MNVEKLLGVGKVAAAHGVAERVDFYRPGGADAGALRGQREAADAVAQGTMGQGAGGWATHAAARW